MYTYKNFNSFKHIHHQSEQWSGALERRSLNRQVLRVRIPPTPFQIFGEFVYCTLPKSLGMKRMAVVVKPRETFLASLLIKLTDCLKFIFVEKRNILQESIRICRTYSEINLSSDDHVCFQTCRSLTRATRHVSTDW